MNEAYLCLGGNLGNCRETFQKSIQILEYHSIKSNLVSALFVSPAWKMEKAPDFYNQVIGVQTTLSAAGLMQKILDTEKELGRERTFSDTYESRPIDIDILFFNDDIIRTPQLEIPHPRLHLRKFVLEPLNEIAPALVHPVFKKTISQLLKECPDKSIVKKLSDAL